MFLRFRRILWSAPKKKRRKRNNNIKTLIIPERNYRVFPGSLVILERARLDENYREEDKKSQREREREAKRVAKRKRNAEKELGESELKEKRKEGKRQKAIQWRLKGCFAREDPISRSTSNQWPAERLVSGRGSEEREEEGYWSDELRKNRPNESTGPLLDQRKERKRERDRGISFVLSFCSRSARQRKIRKAEETEREIPRCWVPGCRK